MKYAFLRPVAFAALALDVCHALAVEIGPGDDFEAAAAALTPGEELVLRGGTYDFNENITVSVNGTPSQPIVIRAKEGERPVLRQGPSNNVIEINGSSYLEFRGIAVTEGSHGIRLMNSDYITIEDCEVFETGDVAISANSGGTYEGLRILRNHIHHTNDTGEGMYLGCNYDNCRIANSLIEGNYVHHTNGPTVVQGDGIEIKEGSYGNIVRNNVIHDTNYPGILLYTTVGNGPPNVVEGNVVWNVNDNTMQIGGDAIVRNNVVLGNVSFQPHQNGRPSNIEFVHNTVVTAGSGISLRSASGPVVIANNAIYAQGTAIAVSGGNTAQVTIAANVGAGGVAGVSGGFLQGNGLGNDMAAADYSGTPPIDPFPAPGSALIDAGDAAYTTAIDFNESARSGNPDAGAYTYQAGGNPGWVIAADFKGITTTRPMSPTDLVVTD